MLKNKKLDNRTKIQVSKVIKNEKIDALYALSRIDMGLEILNGNIGLVDRNGKKMFDNAEKSLERIKLHVLSVYK